MTRPCLHQLCIFCGDNCVGQFSRGRRPSAAAASKPTAPAREVRIQTVGGENIVLTADRLSRLSMEGKKVVAVDQFRVGARVRAISKRAAIGDRIVSVQTTIEPKEDLSG